MPLPVRIRLMVLILTFVALEISFLWLGFVILAFVCFLVALLYVEIRYVQWNFFGSALCSVKGFGSLAVALSFDDGPSPATDKILDILKRYKIKATFFLCGKNVERHPEIARRIVSEGHTIGYHSYAHQKYHTRGPSFIRSDMDRCEKAFQNAGLPAATLIRFPHGAKNIFAVREARRRGLKVCAWNRGVWDPQRPGSAVLAQRCLALKPGEILLLHDGYGVEEHPPREQTVECLELIMPELLRRGLKFVTLSQASR